MAFSIRSIPLSSPLFRLFLFLFLFTASPVVYANVNVGDVICTEGYIMDFYCINRGTLLDNPSVATLEQPEKHSVHCLVDVGSCINSPFEVLIDPIEGSSMFSRGFRLTEESKADVIRLAQGVGSCSTCVQGYSSARLRRGFRAVLKATILQLSEGSDSPPVIEVVEMADSSSLGQDHCKTQFNMTNIVDLVGTNSTLFTTGVESNLRQIQVAHGSLMLASWGFLLPLGAMIAKCFKHRPNGSWFNIHRVLQLIGLILAIIGWYIALSNFDVFADIGYNNYRHGICGMATMVLGILQPLNALIRPHPPKDGESKTTKRFVWEVIHKGSGYIALILSAVTIILGTTLLIEKEDQRSFQIAYGVLVATILAVVGWMLLDKRKYSELDKDESLEKLEAARDEAPN